MSKRARHVANLLAASISLRPRNWLPDSSALDRGTQIDRWMIVPGLKIPPAGGTMGGSSI
jgi:hypothetical protein